MLESQEIRSSTLFELFCCASPRGCRVRTCSLHLVSSPISRTLTCDESEPWLGGKDAACISSAAGHWVWALALTRPPNVSRSRLHRKEFDRRSTRLHTSLDNHVTHVRQEPNIAPAICSAIEGLHTALTLEEGNLVTKDRAHFTAASQTVPGYFSEYPNVR